jgi:hypothetical protein
VLNLRETHAKPYDACPNCLIKIKEQDEPEPLIENKIEDLPKPEIEGNSKQEAVVEEKIPGCQHHLGYLSERAQKEQIPEECLVCQTIVECMLKRVRS